MTNSSRSGSPLPDLFHWLEWEWPFGERQPVRAESYTEQGYYVIRYELPGMDPERDIQLTVEGDQLRINAERTSEERTDQHSEFHYGSFSRTMTLPSDCDTDNIEANYDAGILTVRMPRRGTTQSKQIPVSRGGR